MKNENLMIGIKEEFNSIFLSISDTSTNPFYCEFVLSKKTTLQILEALIKLKNLGSLNDKSK
jgi:hypothetical protein